MILEVENKSQVYTSSLDEETTNYSITEIDKGSHPQVRNRILINNRVIVERRQKQVISEKQTDQELFTVDDREIVELESGSATSQRGISDYRETRVISNKEIQQRVMLASKRAEEKRKIIRDKEINKDFFEET